ncbi:hypothetical protein ACFFX0_20670 [Citricoccus parietis]|uniref:Uncharacterized protein n=1 Tax=Citricoccus parietis TaxID=592307 RepID=A0ABV5G3I5_9MICC
MAAASNCRARAGSGPSIGTHGSRSVPAQNCSGRSSPGSTRPPGKTVAPAEKAMEVARVSVKASGPPPASRNRTTVAASRTGAGSAAGALYSGYGGVLEASYGMDIRTP